MAQNKWSTYVIYVDGWGHHHVVQYEKDALSYEYITLSREEHERLLRSAGFYRAQD